MSDEREKEKLDVPKELASLHGQCDELEACARELLRLAREARDTGRHPWQAFHENARQVRAGLSSLRAVVAAASARSTLERAETGYGNPEGLDQAFEDIKAEMRRLKLDRGKAAYRRPLDMLEDAYLAARYPSSAQGGAASAAVILRAAIDRSIDELVRRRPAQEEAPDRRQRILSIGRHCGRSGLAPAHFDALAADDECVNGELSAKGSGAVMERSELARQFMRGAQFLRALLASVDETVLRP